MPPRTAGTRAKNGKKVCARCLVKKPVSAYSPQPRYVDKLSSFCKVCNGAYNAQYRLQAIALLGGVCTVCGYSDTRALQIDHVFGDGHLERPAKRTQPGPASVYIAVIRQKEPGRYQLLCANCHVIKTRESGEYISLRYRKAARRAAAK